MQGCTIASRVSPIPLAGILPLLVLGVFISTEGQLPNWVIILLAVLGVAGGLVTVVWGFGVFTQQGGQIRKLWRWSRRRGQITFLLPYMPWWASHDTAANSIRSYKGVGLIGIRFNTAIRLRKIKPVFLTDDGSPVNQNYRQITDVFLASDPLKRIGSGSDIYFGEEGRLFDKAYTDEIEIHFLVDDNFNGQVEIEFIPAGDGWWRHQTKRISIAIERTYPVIVDDENDELLPDAVETSKDERKSIRTFQVATPQGTQESTDVSETLRKEQSGRSGGIAEWRQGDKSETYELRPTVLNVDLDLSEPLSTYLLRNGKQRVDLDDTEAGDEWIGVLEVDVVFNEPTVIEDARVFIDNSPYVAYYFRFGAKRWTDIDESFRRRKRGEQESWRLPFGMPMIGPGKFPIYVEVLASAKWWRSVGGVVAIPRPPTIPQPAAATNSQIPAGLTDLIRSVREYGNEATHAVNAVSKFGRFHGIESTSEARECISKFKRQGEALSSTAEATAGDYRNIIGGYTQKITMLVFTKYTSADEVGNAYWEIGSLANEIVNRLREDLPD